jgi:integrase
LTREEVSIFLTTVKEQSPRYYPLFLCALRTGLRQGELLALQWGDIDFRSRFSLVSTQLLTGADLHAEERRESPG